MQKWEKQIEIQNFSEMAITPSPAFRKAYLKDRYERKQSHRDRDQRRNERKGNQSGNVSIELTVILTSFIGLAVIIMVAAARFGGAVSSILNSIQ